MSGWLRLVKVVGVVNYALALIILYYTYVMIIANPYFTATNVTDIFIALGVAGFFYIQGRGLWHRHRYALYSWIPVILLSFPLSFLLMWGI